MNHSESFRRAAVELQTRRFFLEISMACVGGIAFNALLGRHYRLTDVHGHVVKDILT